ncbi:SusC/RagA family TonB-linked outer membrane protein [Pedobacter sp. HDW13]|uniref:SusC/RagA family TonB-linked outer membrane protein n=1 Tax=Pedobacter sp. HDW13 TaxID=2714940 RepID=UPI00140D959E|nr:SusC/RagA family TonB-linked outer membrane protein [Pedobacter sp. HDW13]
MYSENANCRSCEWGIAAQKSSTTFRWLVENYLTYKYKIADHDFTALFGFSKQKDVNDYIAAGSKGFPSDAFLFYNLGAGSTPNGSGVTISNLGNGYNSFKEQATFNSIYGRLNYSYKDKLLVAFTYRADGSSKFGTEKRIARFPAGSIAYKFTDEEFIKNLSTFSNLKLRASYGLTGNDRVMNYLALPTFSIYSTVLNPGGPLQVGTEPRTLPNPYLGWETTRQFNIGLDMGFLNGRINATIDVYAKKTSDLLNNIPIEQYWGFSNQTINAGLIQNRGVEFLLNTVNIRTDNFTWNSNFNIALNRQKVLSLGPINQISVNTANPSGTVSGREFSRVMPGRELGELFGYVYAGVLKTGETYAPQPNSKPGDPKYQDTNGDGKITPDDMTFLGNSTPRYSMGLGNDFHYKGFDLNIFFQGAFGYSLYNMNRLVLESTTGADALNRFVAGVNENTDVPREGYFLSTYGSYVNSRFVEDASYVRLKSVSFGYTVPSKLFDRLKVIKGLKVYAEAQNLFTITNYTGTDPEVNSHSGSNFGGGIDFNAFPAFRTFSAGVKLTIN